MTEEEFCLLKSGDLIRLNSKLFWHNIEIEPSHWDKEETKIIILLKKDRYDLTHYQCDAFTNLAGTLGRAYICSVFLDGKIAKIKVYPSQTELIR
jgi:hypothetical protein